MELTWANRITILRILLIPPFIICVLKANDPSHSVLMRYIALGIFIVMSLSDALDGYLARSLCQVTRLGAFLDPLADKLLMLTSCLIFGSQSTAIDDFQIPITVVVLIIGKDIFLALGFLTLYMMVTTEFKIKPVVFGKCATFLQLVMILTILIGPEMMSFWNGWWYVPRILWWSATAVAVIAVLIYVKNSAKYIRQVDAQS